jgi:hypothetical protein
MLIQTVGRVGHRCYDAELTIVRSEQLSIEHQETIPRSNYTDSDVESPSTAFGVVTGARASTDFVNRSNFGTLKSPSRPMYRCGSACSSGTMLYRVLTVSDRYLVSHNGYSAVEGLLFLLRAGVVCGLSGCRVGQDFCAWNLPMRWYVASNHDRVILTIDRRTCTSL